MKSTTGKTDIGIFLIEHADKINEFYCERCSTNKKSKITVNWTNQEGLTKVICNGCYGYLLSKTQKNYQ